MKLRSGLRKEKGRKMIVNLCPQLGLTLSTKTEGLELHNRTFLTAKTSHCQSLANPEVMWEND